MKRKIPCLAIATVILTTTCICIILLGVFGYVKLNSRIDMLVSGSQTSPSDMQSVIDFMKDQMQHLIWLVGVIITAAGAILGFFGISTRKSIEEQYKQ